MLWLLACTAPGDLPGDLDVAGDFAVVATTDYAVGSLAVVSLDDLAVHDALATTSGDPTVAVSGGEVVQANRKGGDAVRLYEPGRFSAPRVEFALEAGANPHGAAVVGGEVIVALYDRDWLSVHSTADGAEVGRIDLSPWADADGLPEADAVLVVDGLVYVALQRLRRDDAWSSADGFVLEIDPATRQVLQSWETGPNPKISPHEDGIAVLTGVHYVPGDGALRVLDPATGLGPALVVEAPDADLVEYDRDVLVVHHPSDEWHSLACLRDGVLVPGERTPSLISAVRVDARGRAFVAARTNWGHADPSSGALQIWDATTCALEQELPLLLEPYALALSEEAP